MPAPLAHASDALALWGFAEASGGLVGVAVLVVVGAAVTYFVVRWWRTRRGP